MIAQQPIEFEHITQTHLDVLSEYMKKGVSVKDCARVAGLKLPAFKSILTQALGLAGGISYWEPKRDARKKLEHFFREWYAIPRRPASEKQSTEMEAPPRIRACNAPMLHDPAITPQQMECLRQFTTQQNIARAAEAMGMNKIKFKHELRKGLYRAAVIVNPSRATTAGGMCKVDQLRLVHQYFDKLDARPAPVTMDDPMF